MSFEWAAGRRFIYLCSESGYDEEGTPTNEQKFMSSSVVDIRSSRCWATQPDMLALWLNTTDSPIVKRWQYWSCSGKIILRSSSGSLEDTILAVCDNVCQYGRSRNKDNIIGIARKRSRKTNQSDCKSQGDQSCFWRFGSKSSSRPGNKLAVQLLSLLHWYISSGSRKSKLICESLELWVTTASIWDRYLIDCSFGKGSLMEFVSLPHIWHQIISTTNEVRHSFVPLFGANTLDIASRRLRDSWSNYGYQPISGDAQSIRLFRSLRSCYHCWLREYIRRRVNRINNKIHSYIQVINISLLKRTV
jgi:hypothetical protein